jgi:hypothetical protein
MTGVTLSGSTVASNQVFESSGGRALIPNAKGRRETQVSLDGSADPLVKDRQSDTKIDIVTTPVPTVVLSDSRGLPWACPLAAARAAFVR